MPLSDTQVFVALFVALITGILSVRLGYTVIQVNWKAFSQVSPSLDPRLRDCLRMESPLV